VDDVSAAGETRADRIVFCGGRRECISFDGREVDVMQDEWTWTYDDLRVLSFRVAVVVVRCLGEGRIACLLHYCVESGLGNWLEGDDVLIVGLDVCWLRRVMERTGEEDIAVDVLCRESDEKIKLMNAYGV